MKTVPFIAVLVLMAPVASPLPVSAKDKTQDSALKSPVDPNKEICRRVTPTGSMMSRRECRTKAEWSAAEEQSRNQLDRNRQLQGGVGLVGRPGG